MERSLTDEPSDPPIEEQGFRGGVDVVDFGDIRVARGLSRRSPFLRCPHRSMVYDHNERRIWCKDCERTIDAFEAFQALVEQCDKVAKVSERALKEAREAKAHSLLSRAAKVVDKAWRGRRMAPCCPHCRSALLPEDFAEGIKASTSLELERARRASLES